MAISRMSPSVDHQSRGRQTRVAKTRQLFTQCRGSGDAGSPRHERWEDMMAGLHSRRDTLSLGLGLGAALTMPQGLALARAPKATGQAPYYYRFPFGEAQVTVVSDGPLPLGDPGETFLGVSKEEIRGMLSRNFLDPASVTLEQNIPVVNFGDRLVLFDTGMGTSQAFGPTRDGSSNRWRRRASDPPTSTRSAVRTPISTMSGASSAPMASRSFPMRRSGWRKRTSISGPTRENSARRSRPSSSTPARTCCRSATASSSSATSRSSCRESRRSPPPVTPSGTRSS